MESRTAASKKSKLTYGQLDLIGAQRRNSRNYLRSSSGSIHWQCSSKLMNPSKLSRWLLSHHFLMQVVGRTEFMRQAANLSLKVDQLSLVAQ